jgi:hypothetical protein
MLGIAKHAGGWGPGVRAEIPPMVVIGIVLVDCLDKKKKLSSMIVEMSDLKSGLQMNRAVSKT